MSNITEEAKQAAAGTIFNFVLGTIVVAACLGVTAVVAIAVHDDYVESKAAKREALDERITEIAKAFAGLAAAEGKERWLTEFRIYTNREIATLRKKVNAVSSDSYRNITTHRHEGDGVKLGNDADPSRGFPFKSDPNMTIFFDGVIDWSTD